MLFFSNKNPLCFDKGQATLSHPPVPNFLVIVLVRSVSAFLFLTVNISTPGQENLFDFFDVFCNNSEVFSNSIWII